MWFLVSSFSFSMINMPLKKERRERDVIKFNRVHLVLHKIFYEISLVSRNNKNAQKCLFNNNNNNESSGGTKKKDVIKLQEVTFLSNLWFLNRRKIQKIPHFYLLTLTSSLLPFCLSFHLLLIFTPLSLSLTSMMLTLALLEWFFFSPSSFSIYQPNDHHQQPRLKFF